MIHFNNTPLELERAIKERPIEVYNTFLFLSVSNTNKAEQDFAMMGDLGYMQLHLAAMMFRHEIFEHLVKGAILILDANKNAHNTKQDNN